MVWCGTNGRIGAVQRRLLDLERCTAARAGKPTINRLTTPIRNKKNAVYTPIQLHPSCDPVDLLPLLRGAEEGGARDRHAERFFGHGSSHRARGANGSRSGPLDVDDSEIVYIGILPTPFHEDGSRMREMLMLRLNLTEVAAR